MPEVLPLLHEHNFKSLVLMGIEVRCAASERFESISTFSCVVACLRATVNVESLERGYDVHALGMSVA